MFQSKIKFLIVIFLFFFVFASSNLFSQTEEKHPYPIVICPIENCGYATYYFDTDQISLLYSGHMKFIHDKEVSLQDWQSLEKHSEYNPKNPNVKKISCPFENHFTEWSTLEEELMFDLGFHNSFFDNKKPTKEEMKKLIK